MFGNRLGWGISAAIFVFSMLGLYYLGSLATSVGPPTQLGRNAAKYKADLPDDPRNYATWMTEEGTAAELYQQAIAEYLKNPAKYDNYKDKVAFSPGELREVQPALDLLLAAARKRGPGVFADRPEKVIRYDNNLEELFALNRLGEVAERAGWLHANRKKPADPEKAKEYYQASFSLGVKLCEERMTFWEWQRGRERLAVAAFYSSIDEPRKQEWLAFDRSIGDFYKRSIEPVLKAIPSALNPHTGDLGAFASERDADRMWRVEALLALGRTQHSGATRSEQLGSRRIIEENVNQSDPVLRAAANTALNLTIIDFRSLPTEPPKWDGSFRDRLR